MEEDQGEKNSNKKSSEDKNDEKDNQDTTTTPSIPKAQAPTTDDPASASARNPSETATELQKIWGKMRKLNWQKYHCKELLVVRQVSPDERMEREEWMRKKREEWERKRRRE